MVGRGSPNAAPASETPLTRSLELEELSKRVRSVISAGETPEQARRRPPASPELSVAEATRLAFASPAARGRRTRLSGAETVPEAPAPGSDRPRHRLRRRASLNLEKAPEHRSSVLWDDTEPVWGSGATKYRGRYVLNEEGWIVRRWALFVILLIVEEAFRVPYVVAFNSDAQVALDAVVDTIFVLDVAVHFVTAYFDPRLGHAVYDYDAIARNYVGSIWFYVDLCGSVPLVLMATGDRTPLLRTLKMLRMLRMGKLLKRMDSVARASAVQLFYVLGLIVTVTHWVACAWHALAGRWWDESGYDIEGDAPYSTAFYTAMTLIFRNLRSMPVSETEEWFASSCILIGSVLQASAFGSVAVVLGGLSADDAAFQKNVQLVSKRLQQWQVPASMHTRVVQYYDELWRHERRFTSKPDAFLDDLSPALASELRAWRYDALIKSVPFMRNALEGTTDLGVVVEALVRKFHSVNFMAGDFVLRRGELSDWMGFVGTGRACELDDSGELVRVLGVGDYVGELYVSGVEYRVTDVIALSWLQVHVLEKGAFSQVRERYPAHAAELQREMVRSRITSKYSKDTTLARHTRQLLAATLAGGGEHSVSTPSLRRAATAAAGDLRAHERHSSGSLEGVCTLDFAAAPETAAAAEINAAKVLVVDEDDSVVRDVVRPLRAAGYNVALRRSGGDALGFLRSPEGGGTQVVVTEIVMRGMTGLEMLRGMEVRRPVIVYSFLGGDAQILAECRDAGAAAVVPRGRGSSGGSMESLVAAVEEALASAGSSTDAEPVAQADLDAATLSLSPQPEPKPKPKLEPEPAPEPKPAPGPAPERKLSIEIPAGADSAGSLPEVLRPMVIDDSAMTCKIVSRHLGRLGHPNAVIFTNPVEALRELQREPNSVDIAFIDVVMPEMDGMQLLQHLKADPALARLPVVVLSSLSDDEHIKGVALDLGAVAVIGKPVSVESLRSIIESLRTGTLTSMSAVIHAVAETPRPSHGRTVLDTAALAGRRQRQDTPRSGLVSGGVASGSGSGGAAGSGSGGAAPSSRV